MHARLALLVPLALSVFAVPLPTANVRRDCVLCENHVTNSVSSPVPTMLFLMSHFPVTSSHSLKRGTGSILLVATDAMLGPMRRQTPSKREQGSGEVADAMSNPRRQSSPLKHEQDSVETVGVKSNPRRQSSPSKHERDSAETVGVKPSQKRPSKHEQGLGEAVGVLPRWTFLSNNERGSGVEVGARLRSL
jgi:hypothetical protein